MTKEEFVCLRKELEKTQKQMAELLGASLKAVHSYEQGWRNIPVHVERQILFLIARKRGEQKGRRVCWKIKKCPSERKEHCPAWEFQEGKMCWFVNGTICEGEAQKDWHEKMKICQSCNVFTSVA